MNRESPASFYKSSAIIKFLVYVIMVISISIFLVKKIDEPVYPALFSIQAISSSICGFFLQSHGRLVTEKVKTAASVISMILLLSSIVFFILCGKLWPILVPIAIYFFYCPIGAWFCALIQLLYTK